MRLAACEVGGIRGMRVVMLVVCEVGGLCVRLAGCGVGGVATHPALILIRKKLVIKFMDHTLEIFNYSLEIKHREHITC